MRENRLRLFGHVIRREETEAVRSVMELNVEVKRGTGRPKTRCLDIRTIGVARGKWEIVKYEDLGQGRLEKGEIRRIIEEK